MPDQLPNVFRRIVAFFRPEPAPPSPPADLKSRLEQVLGPAYEVRYELGRGAFGIVFGVWDRLLGRHLAIKVLRPEMARAEILQRFQDEARTVARLRHAHIVPLYFIGGGLGLAFMVMPLIEGETLRTTLN